MADFKDLMQQWAELEHQKLDHQQALDDLVKTKSELNHNLEVLKSQYQNLSQKENDIKQQLSKQSVMIKTAKQARLDTENEMTKLNDELKKVRDQRNTALLEWWFSRYPVFNTMSLEELQRFLLRAMVNFDFNSVSGNAGDNDDSSHPRLKGDFGWLSDDPLREKTLDVKLKRNRKNVETTHEYQKMLKLGERNNNHTLTLAEKQRMADNRVDNDPIDTQAEVENRDAYESPLGNRDVDKEVDQYNKKAERAKTEAFKQKLNNELEL